MGLRATHDHQMRWLFPIEFGLNRPQSVAAQLQKNLLLLAHFARATGPYGKTENS
jgi:hypothetical protein